VNRPDGFTEVEYIAFQLMEASGFKLLPDEIMTMYLNDVSRLIDYYNHRHDEESDFLHFGTPDMRQFIHDLVETLLEAF
jgi:hypothetical protein